MKLLKELLYRLRGDFTTEKLVSMGMTVGKHFKRLHGVILNPGHCWLITIDDNVIISANSTVTHDIPTNSVAVGSPARVICPLEEYLSKERTRMASALCYGEKYTLRQDVSKEKRMEQKWELCDTIGHII